MTSFSPKNKYFEYNDKERINREKNKKNSEFLTKSGYRINIQDFNNYQLSKAERELYKKNEEEQYQNVLFKEKKLYFNMSIKELSINFLNVMNQILLDTSHILTKYQEQRTVYWKEWILIFIKDDRIFYVGILFILLSLSMFFITMDD